MFCILTTQKYKKQRKKLSKRERDLLDGVVYQLAQNEVLEPKHKDHKLSGDLKNFRECHVKPDLLLIYQKQEKLLVLTCIAVGSHSDLFE